MILLLVNGLGLLLRELVGEEVVVRLGRVCGDSEGRGAREGLALIDLRLEVVLTSL
jgi:predicted GNAT family N-acyltransferase